MANNTLIGALRVEATLDAGKFVDGAKKIRTESKQTETQVKSSFSGIGSALKAGIAGFVGALSIGAITEVIRAGLNYAKSLKDISAQLGITTKDLQGFRYAAGQLGVSNTLLEAGLQHLTETLGKVAAGAPRPTKALEAIGVTAKQLANVDTGTAFRIIADGLSKVQDRSQRAAVELALFGESGSRLDTLLAGGSDQVDGLADAAERLGIVLSDKEIQNADQTAQKLDDLKAVLSARIADVVADNADSILALGDALASFVGTIGQAVKGWKLLISEFKAGAPFLLRSVLNPGTIPEDIVGFIKAENGADRNFAEQQKKEQFAATYARIQAGATNVVPRRSTGSIPQFLARTPRKSHHRTHTPRDRSEDVEYQFQRDQMQADQAILQAKQQLAHTSDARAQIALQLIALDEKMQDAEIDHNVAVAQRDFAEHKITKAALDEITAQSAILKAKNAEATNLKRQAVIDDQLYQKKQDQAHLVQVDFELQQDALKAQEQLATTAKERRDIELRLLDLSYRQEKARLEAVLADEQASAADKEEARRRLAGLNANYAANRQGVINSTMGPLESYFNGIPHTADQINEALQSIKVDTLEDLTNVLAQVGNGWDAMRNSAIQDLRDIASELLKLGIERELFNLFGNSVLGGGTAGAFNVPQWSVSALSSSGALSAALSGKPGFATGGSFMIGGFPGVDRNLLSLNGLPIARVSHGERVSVSNDNHSAKQSHPPFVFNNYAPMTAQQARETGMQAAAGYADGMAQLRRKGLA